MFMFLYFVMNSFGTDFQIQKTIVAGSNSKDHLNTLSSVGNE